MSKSNQSMHPVRLTHEQIVAVGTKLYVEDRYWSLTLSLDLELFFGSSARDQILAILNEMQEATESITLSEVS